MFSGVKIRGFHGNGMYHELALPDGTHIIIDPFFTGRGDTGFGIDSITRCDYVLITHSHFDHEIDLKPVFQKFRCRVLVPAFSADAVMKYHGIPYDYIFPVLPGETYSFPEFEVHCLRAKHNPTNGRMWNPEKNFDGVDPAHKACDDAGSNDSIDYAITTPNNFRLMTASGESYLKDPFRFAEDFRPDLVLRQAGHRLAGGDMFTGQQYPPEMLADLFLRYGAAVVIPGHYDVLLKRWGDEKTEQYFADVKKAMETKRPGSTLLYPETGKWYTVGVAVAAVPEGEAE